MAGRCARRRARRARPGVGNPSPRVTGESATIPSPGAVSGRRRSTPGSRGRRAGRRGWRAPSRGWRVTRAGASLRDEQVADAVVAVHDGRRARLAARWRQPGTRHPATSGRSRVRLTSQRPVKRLHLAAQVAVGPADRREAGRLRIDRVHLGQGVDQRPRPGARARRACRSPAGSRRSTARRRRASSGRTARRAALGSAHTASTSGTRAPARCRPRDDGRSRAPCRAPTAAAAGGGGRRSTTARRRAPPGTSGSSARRRAARRAPAPRRSRARRRTPRPPRGRAGRATRSSSASPAR